jgi:predicted cupin superfamily sugar epimerase
MTDLNGLDADAVIARLRLAPHPEGGHYREYFRDLGSDGARGHATAIYFLLRAGERSNWHRVDAAEIWLHHAGGPLNLRVAEGDGERCHLLGAGTPAAVVPADAWQSAASVGPWTLVSCVVAPAFDFAGFELAPPGWTPEGAE